MPGERLKCPCGLSSIGTAPSVVTISLSYTMFDITDQAAGRYARRKEALAIDSGHRRLPVAAGDTGVAGD